MKDFRDVLARDDGKHGRVIPPHSVGRIADNYLIVPEGPRKRISVDRDRFIAHANHDAADSCLYVVEIEGYLPVRCHEVIIYGESRAIYAVFPDTDRSLTGASLFIETISRVKLLA